MREGILLFDGTPPACAAIGARINSLEPQVALFNCSAIPDIEHTRPASFAESEAKLCERKRVLWLVGLNRMFL